MIQRQYLTSHVETECPRRKVNCQYCHDTREHQFIEGQHKEECPKLPLPCPNKCEVGSVCREDMEAHRKECPLEMIRCEYYSVGCEVRMARKDKEKHDNEKVKEHLMKTSQVMTSIKDELNGTKLKLTIAKSAQAATKHELTDTKATLVNTNSKLANTERRLTETKATLANAERRLIDTHKNISTFKVLSYLATNKTATGLIITTTAIVIIAAVLELSVGWSDKLVAIAKIPKSDDQVCPVVLKLSEYKYKKENNIKWYSGPFYTHNKGYKMCLGVYADGVDGKGTHMSVGLFLMKGPHDDELTWPLRGKFEIKLLNQISDSEHHSMTLHYDDSASDIAAGRVTEYDHDKATGLGHTQFISSENLNKVTPTCQFLKDDCLFFQVTKL